MQSRIVEYHGKSKVNAIALPNFRGGSILKFMRHTSTALGGNSLLGGEEDGMGTQAEEVYEEDTLAEENKTVSGAKPITSRKLNSSKHRRRALLLASHDLLHRQLWPLDRPSEDEDWSDVFRPLGYDGYTFFKDMAARIAASVDLSTKTRM